MKSYPLIVAIIAFTASAGFGTTNEKSENDLRTTSTVTPKMFGAIGDGASHKVTSVDVDLHNGKWVGTYEPGDEWDYVGLQEAIYNCFNHGTTKPNSSDARLNKLLYIPEGNYLVNKPPTVTLLQGGTISGAGRLATTITSIYAGPAFQTNGCGYTQFTGIQFSGRVAYDGAVFELDGDYDGTNRQGVQANTFKDCLFHGNNTARYGCAIVRRGGDKAQGSENLFLNCHFMYNKVAGFYNGNYNAIQNTFIGGNSGGNLNGFYVFAGSININSMGFQNGFKSQIEDGGFDVVIKNSADSHSSIRNCRTESACFVSVFNNHYVVLDNNNIVNVPPEGDWTAGHDYKQGAITRGISRGNGNGHVHVAMTAGNSSTIEPHWPAKAYVTTGTIQQDSDVITIAETAVNNDSAKSFGVIVYKAGKEGAPLFSTLKKFSDGKWQLADKASATAERVPVRIGPLVVDGGVAWMHYEYTELELNPTACVTNNTFKWGRADFEGGEIANNSFARADAFPLLNSKVLISDSRFTLRNNHLTRNGGWNTGNGSVLAPNASQFDEQKDVKPQ